MSAQHAPHEDAEAPAPVDPYDIVPDSFTDDWNAETIPAALAKAEAAPSTTNPREQERCPDCLAARLTPLPDARGAEWACTECDARHDAVLPALRDARDRARHYPVFEHAAGESRCRGCLSTALYPVPERAPLDARWACLDCAETFDDALPPEIVENRSYVSDKDLRRIQALRREDGQAGLDEVIER